MDVQTRVREDKTFGHSLRFPSREAGRAEDGAAGGGNAELLTAYRKISSDRGCEPRKWVETLLASIPSNLATLGLSLRFSETVDLRTDAIGADEATAVVMTLLSNSRGRRKRECGSRHPAMLPLTLLDLSNSGADNSTVRALCFQCWSLSTRCMLKDLILQNCNLTGAAKHATTDFMWSLASCRPLCRSLQRVFFTGNSQLDCSHTFPWSHFLGRVRLSLLCLQDSGMKSSAVCKVCQALSESPTTPGNLRCLRLGPAADGQMHEVAFRSLLGCIGKLTQLQLLDVKGLTQEQEDAVLEEWRLLKGSNVFICRPSPGHFRISSLEGCECDEEVLPSESLTYTKGAERGRCERQPAGQQGLVNKIWDDQRAPTIWGAAGDHTSDQMTAGYHAKVTGSKDSGLATGSQVPSTLFHHPVIFPPRHPAQRSPLHAIQPAAHQSAQSTGRECTDCSKYDAWRGNDIGTSAANRLGAQLGHSDKVDALRPYGAAETNKRRAERVLRSRKKQKRVRDYFGDQLPPAHERVAMLPGSRSDGGAPARQRKRGRAEWTMSRGGHLKDVLEESDYGSDDGAISQARPSTHSAGRGARHRSRRRPRAGGGSSKKKQGLAAGAKVDDFGLSKRGCDPAVEKQFGPPPGGRVFVAKGDSPGSSDLKGYVSDGFVRPDAELVYTTSADDLDVQKDWEHLGRDGTLNSDSQSVASSTSSEIVPCIGPGRSQRGSSRQKSSLDKSDGRPSAGSKVHRRTVVNSLGTSDEDALGSIVSKKRGLPRNFEIVELDEDESKEQPRDEVGESAGDTGPGSHHDRQLRKGKSSKSKSSKSRDSLPSCHNMGGSPHHKFQAREAHSTGFDAGGDSEHWNNGKLDHGATEDVQLKGGGNMAHTADAVHPEGQRSLAIDLGTGDCSDLLGRPRTPHLGPQSYCDNVSPPGNANGGGTAAVEVGSDGPPIDLTGTREHGSEGKEIGTDSHLFARPDVEERLGGTEDKQKASMRQERVMRRLGFWSWDRQAVHCNDVTIAETCPESERRVRQQVQAYQPMWTSARPRRTNEEPASPRGLRSNAQKGRQKRKRAPRPSHRSRAVLLSRQVGTAPPSSETDSEDNVPLAKKLGIKFSSLQSRHSPPSGQDIDEGDCSDDNIPLAQLVGRRTGFGDVALKEVDQSKQADKGANANHQLAPCTLRGSDVADGVKVDQGGAFTIENKKDGPSVQEDAASPHLVHLPPGSHLSSLVELGQGNRVIADSDQRGTEGLHAIATGMAGILDNKVLPDGEVCSHEGTDIMAAGVSGAGEGNTMDGRLQSSQRAEGVHTSSHDAPQASGIDLACHLGQDVGRDQGPDLGHLDKSAAQPDICQGADTDPEACAADVSMLSVQATQQAYMGGGENGDAAPPSQGEPPESVSAGVPQFYEVVPDSYEDDGL